MPLGLDRALAIDKLCRRYHLPPSVVLTEDISILQMVNIVELFTGHPEPKEDDYV